MQQILRQQHCGTVAVSELAVASESNGKSQLVTGEKIESNNQAAETTIVPARQLQKSLGAVVAELLHVEQCRQRNVQATGGAHWVVREMYKQPAMIAEMGQQCSREATTAVKWRMIYK